MRQFAVRWLALCALLIVARAGAEEADPAAAQILARLKQARPDLDYSTPVPSVMQGIYEVKVAGSTVLYVNAEGSFFVVGDLYALGADGFINVAEKQREQDRRQAIAALPAKDKIIFAPKEVKATLTVFTDVDCGFCRKFHTEVPELNRMGIAVHYLAFPRAGLGSASFRQIATAWCSKDPQGTLTRMKAGEKIPDNVCSGNPVAAELALGSRLGVTGTPALILEDGTLIPGYRPANELAHILGLREEP